MMSLLFCQDTIDDHIILFYDIRVEIWNNCLDNFHQEFYIDQPKRRSVSYKL